MINNEPKAQKLKNAKSRSRKEYLTGFLYILPWLMGFVIFIFIPMILSLIISFTKWNVITGLSGIKFIGFDNYLRIFRKDKDFLQALYVTFKFSLIYVPLSQVFALFIALLLDRQVKGLKVFRTIYFLPSIMPAVAVSLMWTWIFNGQYGIINKFLSNFGIKGPDWLQNPKTALHALIIMGLWGVGNTMIIYLSGLQSVPRHLYEAAEIDGITTAKSFWHITLPLISPTIFFNLVMGIIGSFQYFTQAHVMTSGGPLKSTLFYNLYLYNTAFKEYKMGYASALAWIMFFIITALTAIVFRTSDQWVYYEADIKKTKKKGREV